MQRSTSNAQRSTLNLGGVVAVIAALATLGAGPSTGPVRSPTTRFVDNIDESKAGNLPLPDALLMADGKRVREPETWWRVRRPQLLEQFTEDVYGKAPPPPPLNDPKFPGAETFDVYDTDRAALHGTAVRKQVHVDIDVAAYTAAKYVGSPHIRIDTLIYTPAAAKGPVPLFCCMSFFPLQMITSDPGVTLMDSYNMRTHEPQAGRAADRGRAAAGWPIGEILSRGYGIAVIYYQQIEPDFPGEHPFGIRASFRLPGEQLQPDEWGATAAWAWGASRVMDYLQTDRDVDSHRIAIMGHSRLGKTAMWVGATDSRFALIIGAQPGRGGAAPVRRNYGESLLALTTRYGYQFCPNYATWAHHPADMPIDTNELIDLLAPRPFYQTSSVEDRHSDPKGQFLAEAAAGVVYKLLGADGLDAATMPPVGEPIMHTLGFEYRPGRHEVNAWDWDRFLEFADLQWRHIRPTTRLAE